MGEETARKDAGTVRGRWGARVALLVLAIAGFFSFPGHTYLQQDTQIWLPIIEQLWDPAVLTNDILTRGAHLRFTLFDEAAMAVRRLTNWDFQFVLQLEQLLLRFAALFGVYLFARRFQFSRALAVGAAAIFGLGATIVGPAVLTVEYEPVPRGFAIPLLMLSLGLLSFGRDVAAGMAFAAAFGVHAPTVWPFAALYIYLVLRGRIEAKSLLPLLVALALLAAGSLAQEGVTEDQPFFSRIDDEHARLQQLRASYNWISLWWDRYLLRYALWTALAAAAMWRLRGWMHGRIRWLMSGMIALAWLSVPVSWLLLEQLRWALVPQIQPMRSLLFCVAFGQILAAVAGLKAAQRRAWPEAWAWLFGALLGPVTVLTLPATAAAAGLAVMFVAGAALLESGATWTRLLWSAMLLVPLVVFPSLGKIRNYPALETPELAQLAAWARAETRPDAVFLFRGYPKTNEAGWFRARTLRAIYVDWKGGGQVNYFRSYATLWWQRWQDAIEAPLDPARLSTLGIHFLVLRPSDPAPGPPVYRNSRFAVYPLPRP